MAFCNPPTESVMIKIGLRTAKICWQGLDFGANSKCKGGREEKRKRKGNVGEAIHRQEAAKRANGN